MTVYFHGSFGLDRSVLARLLDSAIKQPEIKDVELAAPFGFGAPFAAKNRSWLHKIGLTELRLPIQLTPLGEVVYENDPALETLTTKWFLHHELTQDPERAEAWHFFIHEFLPQNRVFSREDLLDDITDKLRSHSEQHFGPGSKLNKVIARKMLDCYTMSSGLGDLGFLKVEGGTYLRGRPQGRQGPWSNPGKLKKSYLL